MSDDGVRCGQSDCSMADTPHYHLDRGGAKWVEIPEGGDRSQLSDGFHTFAELYDHRRALTAALCRALMLVASPYRSRLHHDDTMIDGCFIVGLDFPGVGQISYHYELKHWHQFDHVPTFARAPVWDGHTSADVVERLLSWAEVGP